MTPRSYSCRLRDTALNKVLGKAIFARNIERLFLRYDRYLSGVKRLANLA